MDKFLPLHNELYSLLIEWEPRLLGLKHDVISKRRNSQNRSVKQILGHMVDSATNNIHRIVHLHYQKSPVHFPNYASYGNNDRWIAIQNYQEEDWTTLVMLWKYLNLHLGHILLNVDPGALKNEWIADTDKLIALDEMIIDYLRHFKLHLHEIEQLLEG